MRFPVKIKRSIMPRWLASVVPGVHDPRGIIFASENPRLFDDAISSIKIDSTWKTTSAGRHPITDAAICKFARERTGAIIVDVGSSSGLTSLDLIDRMGSAFAHYYVTDLYFAVPYYVRDDVVFFYHPATGRCIIRSGEYCVAYADCEGSPALLGVLARQLLRRAPRSGADGFSMASMVHPTLKARMAVDRRVTMQTFSVLTPWQHESADIIKVANLLNKGYFPESDLLIAMRNLGAALNCGGMLVVTDNREVERVSILSRNSAGKLTLIEEINGGTEFAKLL